MHNLYNAYRAMYEALGVKNIDMVLKPVPKPMPMDPSIEAIQALGGQPFQAFKGQDHRAHITAHLNFMSSSMARGNPMVTASMQKNIFEHISLMALEQVEVEFKDQICNDSTNATTNAGKSCFSARSTDATTDDGCKYADRV